MLLRHGLLLAGMLLVPGGSALAGNLPPLDPLVQRDAISADPQRARAAIMPYVAPGSRVRPADQMAALRLIARSYELQGRYAEAIDYAQRHYDLARQQRDLANMAEALAELGAYNRPLGNLETAVRQLKEATELAGQARAVDIWSEALFNLSVLMMQFGDYENALSYSMEAQTVMQTHGGRPFPPGAFAARATTYVRLGRLREALSALEQAQQGLNPRDTVGQLQLTGLRAWIFDRLNRDAEARSAAQQCLTIQRRYHIDLRETYSCELVLASVSIKARAAREAAGHLDMVRQLLRDTPDQGGASTLILRRDYHRGLAEFARFEGRTTDYANERAIIGELDSKLAAARESSRAAIAAAQIRAEGKDLSIALLQARNANLRMEERERLTWIGAAMVCLLALIAGLFIWYRARQMRLQLEQRHNERVRISRDLHDTLLQNMAGTQMQLQAAAMQAAREHSSLAGHLSVMVDQLGEAMSSAREAVWQMRSAAVDGGDPVAAIREWLQQSRSAGTPLITFDAPEQPVRLTPAVTEDLLRIVQEAVSNAQRHAGARMIGIRLEQDGRALRLEVQDDGNGFCPEKVAPGPAGQWGLAGMRERAARLGGTLEIASQSKPGVGTQITLIFVPGARPA